MVRGGGVNTVVGQADVGDKVPAGVGLSTWTGGRCGLSDAIKSPSVSLCSTMIVYDQTPQAGGAKNNAAWAAFPQAGGAKMRANGVAFILPCEAGEVPAGRRGWFRLSDASSSPSVSLRSPMIVYDQTPQAGGAQESA
jgi:hypothetical protein